MKSNLSIPDPPPELSNLSMDDLAGKLGSSSSMKERPSCAAVKTGSSMSIGDGINATSGLLTVSVERAPVGLVNGGNNIE